MLNLKKVVKNMMKYKYFIMAGVAFIVLVMAFFVYKPFFIALTGMFGLAGAAEGAKAINKKIKELERERQNIRGNVDENTTSDNLSFGQRFIKRKRDKHNK